MTYVNQFVIYKFNFFRINAFSLFKIIITNIQKLVHINTTQQTLLKIAISDQNIFHT